MKKNNTSQGPHKFQHLAKQAGTPMEAIFEAYLINLHKMINDSQIKKKGGGTEIDRQSLDFVVPAPRG